ncbi:MAG: short chain dehydrogenase [Acidimicrobiaceae bacterium]|nr:short chain dehydrogenase [Acidimicrobiaceae bacterium]MCP4794365.1 SDR family oxidoreductase [Actinomycetes bacterium]MDP6105308.1 SDR family oxidoreductase [Acidimicrobiales bacterium]MCP4844091.1 SDR family oxidoreductase [Actinomycetes bacterium]MDP6239546.1 SDR family oxidoreductase [Acidimicrobiales bacterium]
MTAPEYPPGRNLLDGRVVVVTAAAGAGIGFAAAKRCVEEGAVVVVSDVHERRLGEAADSLAELAGERPLAVRCDVTVEDDVQGLFAAAIDAHGHIDVLVNNAGLGGETLLVDMADEEWHRVLDITLTGTMRCTRTALRHMTGRGSGAIVNNASVLGWRAQAGQAHYAAAKAGVMALTRSAAVEAAEYGVRVNCVAPSIAMHPHLAKTSSEELLADLVAGEAFGRAAEPWEVANVMVFLASDLSSYMTGEVVSVSSRHP